MTRGQERELAIRILVDAWRESGVVGFRNRGTLLALLAQADLQSAAPQIEPLTGQWASYGRYCTVRGLSLADPEKALALVQEGEPDPDFLFPTARWCVGRRLPGAGIALDRLIAGARARPQKGRAASSLASCAAIAAELGDPRAPQLVAEVQGMVPGILDETPADQRGSVLFGIAASLAPADLAAALEVEARSPDGIRRRFDVPNLVFTGARQNPAQAKAPIEAAFAELGPAAAEVRDSSILDWARAATLVVEALAPADPTGMEAFARRIPLEGERAVALATVARSLPPERAVALRREALALAARPGGGMQPWDASARVAEAFPPGPQRLHACAETLDILSAPLAHGMMVAPNAGPQGADAIAQVAFLLAPMHPEASRAILDDALVCRRSPKDRYEAQCMQRLARAFCPVDPVRALEAARAIPESYPDARFGACRDIAEYLLASPEARASVRFRDWRFVERPPSGKGEAP